MEAAIKELGARVQHLETANQLEGDLVYRLNRELIAVKSELNATIYRQRDLLNDYSLCKKGPSFAMLFFYIFNLCDNLDNFSVDRIDFLIQMHATI